MEDGVLAAGNWPVFAQNIRDKPLCAGENSRLCVLPR